MLKIEYYEDNINTANLYMDKPDIRKFSRHNPVLIDISNNFSSDRAEVEQFIIDTYKKHFNADIKVSYPVLMSVRTADGKILAALGIRYAIDDPLFLESYIGSNVETELSNRFDKHIDRRSIVEIGNLASVGGGASLFLFAALSSYLDNKNITHVVMTGTDYLHKYFRKIGLKPKEICKADASKLDLNIEKWGSYYETNPKVLAGTVKSGVHNLERRIGTRFEDCKPRLFPRIHYKAGRT